MKCVTFIAALAVLLACVDYNEAACGYKVSFEIGNCGNVKWCKNIKVNWIKNFGMGKSQWILDLIIDWAYTAEYWWGTAHTIIKILVVHKTICYH